MKLRNLFFAFTAIAFLLPSAFQAMAQSVVIVIDQERIMQESKAGKDIVAKLGTITETVNAELTPIADALRREEQSLNERIAPLNQAAIRQDTALVESMKSFQRRAQEFES